jgi:hypothetical protein
MYDDKIEIVPVLEVLKNLKTLLSSGVATPTQRSQGSAKGKVVLEKDFDAPLPNSILKGFEQ